MHAVQVFIWKGLTFGVKMKRNSKQRLLL